MKRGYCEMCSPVTDDCVVCGILQTGGQCGRAVDHDADTLPADTLPEVAALTRADLDALDTEPIGAGLLLVALAGALLWGCAVLYAVGRSSKWW